MKRKITPRPNRKIISRLSEVEVTAGGAEFDVNVQNGNLDIQTNGEKLLYKVEVEKTNFLGTFYIDLDIVELIKQPNGSLLMKVTVGPTGIEKEGIIGDTALKDVATNIKNNKSPFKITTPENIFQFTKI